MDLGLKGKVAIVAAASKGLGRACAAELAAEGARVVMCARGEEALAEARNAIAAAGGEAVAITADVASAADIARVIALANDEYGPVDILVTNGGGPQPGPFDEHGEEAWHEGVESTLMSVVRFVRGVLPGMKERGWGRIINITSIAVKQPVDGLILSNSIRAAVTGFGRTLANEVGGHGITVNNVMPGFTWTDRVEELAEKQSAASGKSRDEIVAGWEASIPVGRLGEPNELGALVAFLASERAAYINAQSIPVDGGWIRSLL
jgi:3-oxoacyl-[acyl-carrier protein] reductase